MKALLFGLATLAASQAYAADTRTLTADELKSRVADVTQAQNKVMMNGSTTADVDALFSLYAPDFVYVHEVYGGTYTRDQLYKNTQRVLERGRYDLTTPRYTITSVIPGYNGIAVEREEISKGQAKRHLAVFEFRGDKVSKIIEYWK